MLAIPIRSGPLMLLNLINNVRAHHKKKGAYISIDTIRERLEKWYNINVTSRTVKRWMKWLDDMSFINRKVFRVVRDGGRFSGTLCMKFLTKKGYHLLASIASTFMKGLRNLPRGHSRHPITLSESKITGSRPVTRRKIPVPVPPDMVFSRRRALLPKIKAFVNQLKAQN